MATAKPDHSAALSAREGDLAPMLAGAYARGMFDALDLIGQGALLLGRDGRVLAVTRSAAPAFGRTLAVAQGRPVSAEPEDNSLLREAILRALAGDAREIEIGAAGEELTLRVTPVTGGPHQLLAAILAIQPVAAPAQAILCAPAREARRRPARI